MRDRVALILCSLTAVLHLAVANRYDIFRDELYFIVCGRHPQFGYVDQPPLIPLLSAGLAALGLHAWIIRLPAVAAAVLLVYLTITFARFLGGGDGAAWFAGIAVAIAPMLMGLTASLNTTALEPLAWTAVAYFLARAAIADDTPALLWAGLVAGLAMEAKYALFSWLAVLAVGLLLTPQRRVLLRPALWAGLGIAVLIALPSVIWQASHGWPFIELVHAAGAKNTRVPAIAFVLNQVSVMNLVLAPLWLAGIVAPFVWKPLRNVRFLAIAYLAQLALMLATPSKDYYLAPTYPTLFAIGAVAFERIFKNVVARVVYFVLALALSAIAAPLALPILAPDSILPYERALHIAPQAQERAAATTALPQEYADELGWHDFVRQVGTAYDSLAPDVRAKTSILVGNYGEAGALDVYGAPYGLPPALTGHNQYYLWGLRGQNPENILRVQDRVGPLRKYCRSVRVLDTTRSQYAMAYENGQIIAFCAGLHPPLASVWPRLKNYN